MQLPALLVLLLTSASLASAQANGGATSLVATNPVLQSYLSSLASSGDAVLMSQTVTLTTHSTVVGAGGSTSVATLAATTVARAPAAGVVTAAPQAVAVAAIGGAAALFL